MQYLPVEALEMIVFQNNNEVDSDDDKGDDDNLCEDDYFYDYDYKYVYGSEEAVCSIQIKFESYLNENC